MKYFISKNKKYFWGIDFVVDANEIILHYGYNGRPGRVHTVYNGYDGDEGYQEVQRRIRAKKRLGYKSSKKQGNTMKLFLEYGERESLNRD